MGRELTYKGVLCKARRVNVYVKRGAYAHGYVKGWELVDPDGNVVVDSHPGRPHAAYEYQTAKYTTFKQLASHVEDENEHFERMQARKNHTGPASDQ